MLRNYYFIYSLDVHRTIEHQDLFLEPSYIHKIEYQIGYSFEKERRKSCSQTDCQYTELKSTYFRRIGYRVNKVFQQNKRVILPDSQVE